MKRVSEMMETNRKKSNMEPYFQATPQKKTRPQEFTLHRAVEKLRVFYQVMLLGSKPMGSNQGSLGVTARFMGPHLLGVLGPLGRQKM